MKTSDLYNAISATRVEATKRRVEATKRRYQLAVASVAAGEMTIRQAADHYMIDRAVLATIEQEATA